MKKYNVLVFPCGSEIGLEINRSLANSIHFNLFGASSISNHGEFVYKNYFGNVPSIENEDSCIAEINKIVDENHIDFIFPAHDSVVLSFSKNLNKLHSPVATSPFETCKVCRSKLLTYNVLKNQVLVPKVFSHVDDLCFPLFAKPDIGQGSKGAHIIRNYEDYDFYVKNRKDIVLTEYLPGEEYTIDCFTDKNRRLLFCRGRIRARINNGISVRSYPVDNQEFIKIAEKINSVLRFKGVWFFQLKEDANGKLVLLEIAPRIAGTMGLFRGMGVNFAQLTLFDALGYDLSVLQNKFLIESDRALFTRYKTDIDYKYVYIDFDDTIVVDEKVNVEMIKFLYQCKNYKKNIILLTRHKNNIYTSLANHLIDKKFFDEIIVIKDRNIKKSAYIKHINSIFIDDSYSERLEVSNSKHIPVFSTDSIDVLFEYKN